MLSKRLETSPNDYSRIVVANGSSPANPEGNLVRLLVRANAIREKLPADRSLTLQESAKSESVVPSHATRLFRLTVLAHDIVNAIFNGRHQGAGAPALP